MRPYPHLVIAALLALGATVTIPAHAALGGDTASIAKDAAAVSGTDVVTPRPQYEIHVIIGAAGTRIAEYLGSDGRVFAVTWTGPVMPDLRALLGIHFAAFSAALAAGPPHAPHAALRVTTPAIVVESSGHMRAMIGRAYLPDRLPAAMLVSDVR